MVLRKTPYAHCNIAFSLRVRHHRAAATATVVSILRFPSCSFPSASGLISLTSNAFSRATLLSRHKTTAVPHTVGDMTLRVDAGYCRRRSSHAAFRTLPARNIRVHCRQHAFTALPTAHAAARLKLPTSAAEHAGRGCLLNHGPYSATRGAASFFGCPVAAPFRWDSYTHAAAPRRASSTWVLACCTNPA